ncbi:helix-turn-helix protein [Thermodesulfitimonas autotrophica]|uniref:Helix-turn-helix protein n=1 Tax=Thermodesulfitimonas autotrophica TaxID=1894989 RepID=A0A3N5AX66_9THEO|nr:helix-turn-helix domain-containing protein [Thermodesulfitimonas autotrophica]RPF49619.1 helix-turn-helix protein [Thermodesulfitimonas autotrophica]
MANKELIVTDVLQDARRKDWFWDHNAVFDSDLSANAKLVRLYLARCADGERAAYPSLNTIASRCGLSKPTVIKALKELEEKGWLVRTGRVTAKQEHQTNVYLLVTPEPEKQADRDKKEGGGKAALPPVKNITGKEEGVVNQFYQVVNDVDQVVKQVDPNNTHIRIPTELEDVPTSLPSSWGEGAGKHPPEGNNPGEKVHARAPSREAPSADKCPQARTAGSAAKTVTEDDELVAELVQEYRSIKRVKPSKGDRLLIGSLLAEHGYARVYEAIEELRQAIEAQEVRKPLLYLKAICARLAGGGGKEDRRNVPPGRRRNHTFTESAESRWWSEEDRRGRKELLRSLYCN